jgi:hypothetical protein
VIDFEDDRCWTVTRDTYLTVPSIKVIPKLTRNTISITVSRVLTRVLARVLTGTVGGVGSGVVG